MSDQQPTNVYVVQERPTTKQQLSSAAIQVGASLAVPVVIFGAYAVAANVGKLKDRIKTKKAAKLATVTDLHKEA